MIEWIASCLTVALVSVFVFLRKRLQVGDDWRKFTSYPMTNQFVTGGGSSTTITTHYNKGAPQTHWVDSSLWWIFLDPAIVFVAPLMAFLVALVLGGGALIFVVTMKCNEKTYLHWSIPLGLAATYFLSVDQVLGQTMVVQAKRERKLAYKFDFADPVGSSLPPIGVVVERQSLFELFILPGWFKRWAERQSRANEEERNQRERRARERMRKPVTQPVREVRAAALQCPECGAQYRSTDYRDDAEVWFCSACKGVLRRKASR